MPTAPAPSTDTPFEIGGPTPIVLDRSTVPGIESHFVDRGRGTPELDAFRQVASGRETFLDIGAAAGVFSAAFCALTGQRAYAFEPSPVMYEHLEALIALNPALQITPSKLALGAADGVQTVTSSSNGQFRAVEATREESQAMRVETLDSFVGSHQISPDLAKIDVEGMELAVLTGGAKTFADSVQTLLLEVHPNIIGDMATVADIERIVRGFGFRILSLTFSPIADLRRHIESGPPAMRRATNLVCLKE